MQSWEGRWPLVGRQTHLASFRKDLVAGDIRGWLVCGPAGVGKTRLSDEFLDLAAAEKRRTVKAVASRAAAQVPLGAIAHILPAGVDMADPVQGFRAVAQALAGLPQPTVVLVDDLHLLDNSSAALLGQLLDSGTIVLIGTARTGERSSDVVDGLLQRGDHIRRTDLDHMVRDQVEELLQRVLEGPVSRRALHTLLGASDGNPLFLRELVLGAMAQGNLTLNRGVWDTSEEPLRVTPHLRDLIAGRIASSSPATRPLLAALAFCRSLSLSDAAVLADRTDLERLERSGIVEISVQGARVTVALAHPLYGEVIAADTSALQRYDIALQQAERVGSHGLRRREDALHVASWLLAATGTAEPALLRQAAAIAMNSNDNEHVIELLSAIKADQHTSESRVLLGRALMHTGRLDQAEVVLAEADAQAANDYEKIIAATTRCINLYWSDPDPAPAVAVCAAARATLSDQTAAQQLRIMEGAMLTVGGSPVPGLQILNELPDTPSEEALDVWLATISAKTMGLTFVGKVEQAQALAEHAKSIHEAVGEGKLLPHPVMQVAPLALSLMERGRIDQAREICLSAADRLQDTHSPVARQFLAYESARAEWLAGRPVSARRWYAEGVATSRTYGLDRVTRLHLSGLMACTALVGDLDTAASLVADYEASKTSGGLAGEESLGVAWLHAARGELSHARDLLRTAADRARKTGHLVSEALLLTDIARLGDAKAVHERMAELSTSGDGALTSARARFVAALANRDPQELMACSEELDGMGARLLAAESAAEAANAWRRKGDTRKVTAATAGATRLADQCEGARTPILSSIADDVEPLTRREQEIALLAASGKTSKAISQHLMLSVRTVDNHLQRIYLKLGVRSRRDLALALKHEEPSHRA
ncbi:LuxR C-terminal-related transcriptional regulator [Streptomyces aureus]|uniref:LuxR C-terminal-related transcriptional regulator n=1 Tax=Streptomyces aureus TaxID=193461 RepID=UPI000565E776|nr:LuxR family transcriptional regulator [Streptomyces aureus]